MIDLPAVLDPAQAALTQLFAECQAQIRTYRQGKQTSDSVSCAEIVRRAAQGERAALVLLLQISDPLVRQKCPRNLRAVADDIVQEVNIRLVRKFCSPVSPYRPSAFPAYHAYLNLTAISVISNWIRDAGPQPLSLEQLYTDQGLEPVAAHSIEEQTKVEERDRLQRLLALLSDPLVREAFYRRYLLEESPDEITSNLQPIKPGLTKKEVYRLLERAMKYLKQHPQVQQLLQD